MKSRRQIQTAIVSALFLMVAVCSSGLAEGTDKASGDNTLSESSKPLFKVTASIREGYDDNVYTAHTNKIESFFTDAYGHIQADLGHGSTVFTIGLGGGATYYYDRPGRAFDYKGDFSIGVVHKFNNRLTVSFQSFTTYQTEPNFDAQVLVSQNRRDGQYLYTNNVLTATYQWSRRLQTISSYTLYGVFYEDAATRLVEDRFEHTISNQLLYLMNPTTQLTASYRLGYTEYLHNTQRDRITNYFLVGFNHSFSPKFSVNLNTGAQVEIPKQGATQSSPYAEVTATYAYQRYSNLQWYLRYGFDHSGITLTDKHTALRTGVKITQAITPRLNFYIGIFYQHDDTTQTVGASNKLTEDTFDISTGLNFTVTPKLSLQAGYTHTELLSNTNTLEYSRNLFTLGANYTF